MKLAQEDKDIFWLFLLGPPVLCVVVLWISLIIKLGLIGVKLIWLNTEFI